METSPATCRTLEEYYHVYANTFEKQYKDHLSGFRGWEQLSHADQWIIFPENIGASICIDETALSNGELYTILTNRSCRGGKGTLIAIVKGVSADKVTEVIMRIDEQRRSVVREITMDISNSMHLIAKRCFSNAMRTIDRLPTMHCRKCASHSAGMQSKPIPMQERRQNVRATPTRPLCLPMVTRQDSCRHVVDTCSSSQQTSGPKAGNKEQEFSSSNTPISAKPIRLRTLYV